MKEQSGKTAENKMGIMSEGKLLANMAIPLIISMLVQALYNIVDSVYVSRISGSAVTALSLAFPVQNLLIGFSSGIAIGVNSLFSRSLGARKQGQANQSAGNGFLLIGAASVLFVLFGLFGSHPYYAIQSEIAETVEGGSAYVLIVSTFSQGIFIEMLCERMLQGSGRSFHSMITQGTGALINIVLDPILIFNCGMGIAGAAVATVIGQWIAGAMALFFNLKFNSDVQLSAAAFKPDRKIIRDILAVGIPAMIMMVISSFMNFGMNQILQGFTETATGVFGIYYKLQSFFFMPIFGLNNANISILAYNYGARRPDRMMKTIRICCAVAFVIMTAGLLAFQFMPETLMSLFNADAEFMEIGCAALRIISVHFQLAAFAIILSACFQAVGIGIYSTIVSLLRQLVVLLPAAFLLSLSGRIEMVWWSFPIAEVVSLAVTIIFFLRVYNRKIKPLRKAVNKA